MNFCVCFVHDKVSDQPITSVQKMGESGKVDKKCSVVMHVLVGEVCKPNSIILIKKFVPGDPEWERNMGLPMTAQGPRMAAVAFKIPGDKFLDRRSTSSHCE